MTPQQLLTKYWGYTHFRPLQEDVIQSVLNNRDTLALMPTGGGKSVCFQLPALMKEGICIVISPLIALMKDQVDALQRKGIKAIAVTSAMHKREIDVALDNCAYGDVKFLYVSPERLATDLFKARVIKMNVNLIAVDEAHCISQWGYDFRPAYLQVAELRQLLPLVPVLALTATATTHVTKDIQQRLIFKKENLLQVSFERKNLAYMVLKEENKSARLLKIINKVKGSGIIYVRNRKKTEEIAKFLKQNLVPADFYHAGLPAALRNTKQEDWNKNKTSVMVCTNAFGMGIDKPDVRFVIHMDLPDCLEAYFQEAGRAGRDEKKAYAVLLYNEADSLNLQQSIIESFPPVEEIKSIYNALGNYYQLAVGSGENQAFDFDIAAFANNYNLKTLTVFNCIKFLEREGYISVTEALNQPTRILIKLNKEDLYKFQVANKTYDEFIKTILRSYTGLMTGFVKINETDIATRMNLKREDVVKTLKKLNELELIEYIPQSVLPQLFYVKERLDIKNLHISKEHYTDLKNRAIERMEWMIHYITTKHKCRSQLLLSYFGEKDAYRCGTCDVCLERNKLGLSNLEFENVSAQLKNLLKAKPLMLTELVNAVKDSRDDKTLKVIQWLLDNHKLAYDEEGLLEWRK